MKLQRWMSLGWGAGLGLAANLAHGADSLDLSPLPITGFLALIMYVVLAVLVVVFGAMLYSIFAHRKSAGRHATHFHRNTAVEVVWTAIPFVILMSAAYPATKTIIDHQAVYQFGERQIGEQRVASR